MSHVARARGGRQHDMLTFLLDEMNSGDLESDAMSFVRPQIWGSAVARGSHLVRGCCVSLRLFLSRCYWESALSERGCCGAIRLSLS